MSRAPWFALCRLYAAGGGPGRNRARLAELADAARQSLGDERALALGEESPLLALADRSDPFAALLPALTREGARGEPRAASRRERPPRPAAATPEPPGRHPDGDPEPLLAQAGRSPIGEPDPAPDTAAPPRRRPRPAPARPSRRAGAPPTPGARAAGTAPTGVEGRRPTPPRRLSPEAATAADRRLRLDAPSGEVERLLAAAAPAVGPRSAGGGEPAALAEARREAPVEARREATVEARREAPVAGTPTAPTGGEPTGILLERALGRIERLRPAARPDAGARRGSALPGAALPGASPPPGAARPDTAGPPPRGGFRGLAARALQAGGAETGRPAIALGAETRLPAEIDRDSLDAAVAESLTRTLEREARRQGIDLAESER